MVNCQYNYGDVIQNQNVQVKQDHKQYRNDIVHWVSNFMRTINDWENYVTFPLDKSMWKPKVPTRVAFFL